MHLFCLCLCVHVCSSVMTGGWSLKRISILCLFPLPNNPNVSTTWSQREKQDRRSGSGLPSALPQCSPCTDTGDLPQDICQSFLSVFLLPLFLLFLVAGVCIHSFSLMGGSQNSWYLIWQIVKRNGQLSDKLGFFRWFEQLDLEISCHNIYSNVIHRNTNRTLVVHFWTRRWMENMLRSIWTLSSVLKWCTLFIHETKYSFYPREWQIQDTKKLPELSLSK